LLVEFVISLNIPWLWNIGFLMTADKDSELYILLKKGWMDQADQFVMQSAEEGYGISLTPKEYIWGSNMLVMNRAMVLLIANYFEQNNVYVQTGLDHLHYLLGRNAMNISYVTGFGANAILNPHYRPSMALSNVNPVPGLVSGGPASGLRDDYAAKVLKGQPPAKSFVDHHKSYSTNEVTIYWNSPVVFVVSHFVDK
jgi:endoglucanase